jgi:hypothetical protein
VRGLFNFFSEKNKRQANFNDFALSFRKIAKVIDLLNISSTFAPIFQRILANVGSL